MIEVVRATCAQHYVDQIVEMHRLRYKVFYERLGWEVSISGDMEIDEYDAMDPIYLLRFGKEQSLIGCVRLLPTLGEYMLRNTFPILAGDHPIPKSNRIWEASRFAVSTRSDRSTSQPISQVTSELFAALVEIGIDNDLESIVAVVDVRMERILRLAGWPLERFTAPQHVGITRAVAGFLEVSNSALTRIRSIGGLGDQITRSIRYGRAA